jgi:hypothetical protein
LAKFRTGSRGVLHPMVAIVHEKGAEEKEADVPLRDGSCCVEPLA